jgi:hypothetical protein
VFGYVVTALLYFAAWLNPRFGSGERLIGWVTFNKFCLTEFLSCHAITLLAGTALAVQIEGGSKEFMRIFWGLLAFYFIMGSFAYLLHRDHGALIGFYAILVTRGLGILSLQTADEDMLRAEVLKNLLMFAPMMLLIAAVSFGDGSGTSWRETFIQGRHSFAEKIVQGRSLLYVAAYYILWALVAWKWPLRIANK